MQRKEQSISLKTKQKQVKQDIVILLVADRPDAYSNTEMDKVRQLTAAPAEQVRKVVRVTYLPWKLSELKKL